jgi:signal transduction histidine kinase
MLDKDLTVSNITAEKQDSNFPVIGGNAGSDAPAMFSQKELSSDSDTYIHSNFLANISHDFRTPMAALNASLEYLLDDFYQLSREDIYRLLKSVHLSVNNLQTLIDNLLESSNIEAGRFTIRPRSIELSDVISEAIHVIQPFFDRRMQKLTTDVPEELPDIFGDHLRLRQVLVNLLSNASKFGPLGQPIHISAEVAEDGMVRVSIADRGPGIPEQYRKNLFQRFLRLNEPDGAQYGIGLGLSVVKIIVEEHTGSVGVAERPGGGSIFWFTVPCAKTGG